jgi:hypothetical protein
LPGSAAEVSLSRDNLNRSIRTTGDDGAKAAVYVGLLAENVILGYPKSNSNNGGPVCTISTGVKTPLQLTADKSGNIYVTNANGFSPPYTVSEYGPQCGSQVASVTDTYGGPPRQVALDGKTWYLGNQYGLDYGDANIAVCSASGCTSALQALGENTMTQLGGVAVDAHGNVYASAYTIGNDSGVSLVEWKDGKGKGKVIYSYGTAGDGPNPLEIDDQGNILANGSGSSNFYVISGCPSACTTNGPYTIQGIGGTFTLNKKNHTLYVTDNDEGDPGSVAVYTYNRTAAPTYQYDFTNGMSSSGVPFGIAVTPPSKP